MDGVFLFIVTKMGYNESLDEIPEDVYDRYLGRRLKVSMAIPQIKTFVGRNSELLKLSNSLDNNSIIIEGIAGIGKTYVATRFAEEIKDEYNVHWYGDLSEVSTLSSVMKRLAEVLKDNGRPRLFNSIENLGYDIDVLITILKDELADNRFAIFFDNYHKAEAELNPLMKQLLYIKPSKIILVTREEPAFYNVVDERENRVAKIKIDHWDDYGDTQEMFRLRGIETADDAALREIHNRLHGHPQYLNLFCILAQKSKPEELLEKLPKAQEDAHSYLEKEVYDSLESDEKYLLKTIAVYRIPETIDAFLSVEEFTDVDEVLNGLINKFLVNEIGIDTYNVHEIIRDYCLSDVRRRRTLRSYHKSAAEYYLSKDTNPESLLEASYHYIEAGEHEKSAEIVINNAKDFIDNGFWKKIEYPLKDTIKTFSRRRHDRNALHVVGLAHLRIGDFYLRRGDLDMALEHAEKSKGAFARIGGEEKFDLYTLFGGIYGEMHEIDESREYFEKSLDFAKKNDDNYRTAVAHANIGLVYSSEGDKTKAIELYLNSLKFFEEHNHTINAATACNNIANAYSYLDKYNKAYDFIKKAIELYEGTGAYHIAGTYVTYAKIYLNDPANKGNLDPVLEYLSRSLEIYEKIGHLRGEALVYLRIGDYYKRQGDYKSAIDYYEKSISIYKILNKKSKLGDVYSSIGTCYVKLKEYQKAKGCFEKALGLNSNLSDKLSLAEVYINLDEFNDAIDISEGVLADNDTDYRSKCLSHIFTSISLFSLGMETESYTNIKELIRYHSMNKSTAGELGWDFSDLAEALDNLDSSKRILIEDLISLMQNKTAYPAIRVDQVNIEREEAGSCAEVFHPFVGCKTLTKDGDSLKKIMKDLSTRDIEINIDESVVMGIERDTALMTLGFLHKKGFIYFNEIAPNTLKIGLTNRGRQKISKSAK
jgi:tetratricopeptide (TPR) repeat protein